jgi:hypothetical protein
VIAVFLDDESIISRLEFSFAKHLTALSKSRLQII